MHYDVVLPFKEDLQISPGRQRIGAPLLHINTTSAYPRFW